MELGRKASRKNSVADFNGRRNIRVSIFQSRVGHLMDFISL
jgi:hypothetical protein